MYICHSASLANSSDDFFTKKGTFSLIHPAEGGTYLCDRNRLYSLKDLWYNLLNLFRDYLSYTDCSVTAGGMSLVCEEHG